MKQVLIFFLLFSTTSLLAQLTEDFSDGDFTNNPVWTGSNNGNDFTIVDYKLRSNSGITNTSFFLSTVNTLADNVQWELWVNLQFSTSGSNYIDIYVISDKADLQASLINGYFIRIGNTDDEISLYKRSGTSATSQKIIDGVNGSVGTSNNVVKVRLKRSTSGNFTLEREIISTGSSYFSEGNITDLSHPASSHFGILVQQSTSSFFLKHYIDSIRISSLLSDNISPTLTSVSSVDSNTVEIVFDEAMDSASAKNVLNYSVSSSAGPVIKVLTTSDRAKYQLKLAAALNSGTYLVTATNVKDVNGNLINGGNSASFSYTKPYKAKFGEVVINEILADPSPQIDLPSVEFAELRNNTNQSLLLKNWKFSDSGSSATLGEITIEPNALLIICAKADTNEFKLFGKVHGISPWPSLINSGELLKLTSPEGLPIDSVRYSDAWYRNPTKKSGGWTLERRDPLTNCAGLFNWFASADSTGGTPGRDNSIHIAGYDNLPLTVDSLKQLSDTSITISFNKHLNGATLLPENFSITPNTSSIRKISADPDFLKLVITYDRKFQPGLKYQMNISNVKDCSGITITNVAEKLQFETIQPAHVIQKIDTAKVNITEIFADPSPEIHLPLVEFIEIYNPSKDTVDLDKWTINDPAVKATINRQKIFPDQYIILCPIADTTLYQPHGKTIGLNPWPSLNNTSDQVVLKSFRNRTVDSVAYVDTWYHSTLKKAGGWSIEKIALKSPCQDLFNWSASLDTSGGTPGKINSINPSMAGAKGLKADSLKLLSDTTVKIYFNTHLNSATLLPQNFRLFPSTDSLKKVSSNSEFREITLTYKGKLRPGTVYQISIVNLKDCGGNSIAPTPALEFKISRPIVTLPQRTDTAAIFITEIFADPSPEVHLPLSEFIEIYNPSKDTVDLDKWTLNDPTTRTAIRGQQILPNEYIILCPVADTANYKTYGKTIGLNPWPSLNNAADKIILKNFKDRAIDSLSYSDEWYRSSIKRSGGWSMEKIDLNSLCVGVSNWTASIDSNGGTPGKKNSVNVTGYDAMTLKSDSLKVITDTTIRLYFSKHLDGGTLLAENFLLTPSNSLKKIITDTQFKEVTLTFESKFQPRIEYQLAISKLKDCSGNFIAATRSLRFRASEPPPPVPEKTDTSRILITEIFADPSPEIGLPLVEFIELYNPGSETVDLDKWTINDTGTKGNISRTSISPGNYLILCPAADTLLYKQFGKTKGVSPWPSLGNMSDQLTLKSFKQRTVDSVAYSDKWYKNRVKKNGGWSLERIELLTNSCDGFYNWESSTFHEGGTPGRSNSVKRQAANQSQIRIDSLRQTSDSTVILHLSAIPETLHLKSNYFSIDKTIGAATGILVEENYTIIHLKFASKFLEGITYILTADSLLNCRGEKASGVNNQVSFTVPVIPELDYPIIINEIFADPSPRVGLPETEFVELYNPSEKEVSLAGMSYGSGAIEHKFKWGQILPKSYLILCPSKDSVIFSAYGKVHGLPAWPSLSNEKDVIILKNNKGRVFQKVSYSAGWYKDAGKKAGGYSLELMNTASVCTGSQNWGASVDAAGGTPGKINSIHSNAPADVLKLSAVVMTDSVTLLLTFNRAVDSLTASRSINYMINNGIGNPGSVQMISSSFEQVQLKLRVPPLRGHTYNIEVKDVQDCMGTEISSSFNNGEFILTQKVLKSSLLISEVLFNPRSNGTDFVEIYNNTKHILDLQEVSIATILKDTISSSKRIITKQLLFEPGHYIAVTSDPDILKKEYRVENADRILQASLPSLNDDKGIVVLLSDGARIDQLNYSEKMHFQLLKNFEGVSLERSSFLLNGNESGNFRSATSASGFATPGYKNSQYEPGTMSSNEFTLASKTFSPDNDGFEDLLQVSYRMPVPGMVANVRIFTDKGILIKYLLKNMTLNTEGVFTWDGLNDLNTAAGTGIYVMYAEIFDTNGNLKYYRKAFALATRF
jgi:hypothetical protein